MVMFTCVFPYVLYSNAGGGGEKVLWCIIKSLQDRMVGYDIEYVIYSGEKVDDMDILDKARNRFDVDIKGHVKFV